jgi:extradiol dioxygenase family protein
MERDLMFKGVHHLGYLTDDIGAAHRFFADKFHGQVLRESTSADGSKALFMQMGEVEVEIIEPADKSKLGGQKGLVIEHVGLLVEDFEGAKAGLEQKGIRFVASAAPAGSPRPRIAYMETESTLGTRIHLSRMTS